MLNISQPGQAGGYAVADILFGKAVPSGKLTATWARHYGDYPSADTYGYRNGALEKEEYREEISLDTVILTGKICRYYFRSGTDFPTHHSTSASGLYARKRIPWNLQCLCRIRVEPMPGRRQCRSMRHSRRPEWKKGKKAAGGIRQNKMSAAGEIQQLEIKIPKNMLASFSEEQSAWYLEAGTYGIWIGADSQKLEQAWEFDVYERTITEHTCRLEAAESDAGKLSAAEEQKVHLTGKIPAEELIPLLYGHVEQNSSTLGAAGIRVPGSAGETTHALEQPYGIRALIMADGPAGIRLHQSYEVDADSGKVYGKKCTGSTGKWLSGADAKA